ncbi:MAG: polysaccharide biosynthesis tyrosine autokinase [Verrucomicrobiota bacterium]|nr:polysaccharide biosynthesis tyrosine autokinase [Verrucomicrobiota bacterium]
MEQTMPSGHENRIDFRVYIGVALVHWKIIVLCFLYGLLGGVLYILFTPKTHEARCTVLTYRDPNLQIMPSTSPWDSYSAHVFLITNEDIKRRAAKRVAQAQTRDGATSVVREALEVELRRGRTLQATMEISTRGPDRGYCMAFLSALLAEHTNEWHSIQMEASASASRLLDQELAKLEGDITKAEDDLIEYQRLHDIARVEARGSLESRYLMALMERHSQLATELMMLESQYPLLKDAGAGVISHAGALTRDTGAVKPLPAAPEAFAEKRAAGAAEEPEAPLPPAVAEKPAAATKADTGHGWHEMRVKLSRLAQKEKSLAENLKPEHPQLRALRIEIENLQAQIDLAAEIEMNNLMDRHKAIAIQLKALREAEEKWQARNLLAGRRRAELKRIATVVDRYEDNHRTLYGRLHDLRVSSEMKAEHFRVVEPVSAPLRPVWPDLRKILLVALVLGLGAGLGLTLVVEAFNNRIQSVKDVETELGIPFLGGVPYWSRSDLESSVRPIVMEEHSMGAIEAYRALRTTILAALEKRNEKILVITSADSREGKTLTALNLAIIVAQIGKKVLLLDMDLRRGRLHRSLEIEREPGMSDVLARRIALRDVIRRTRIENLDLAPTGRHTENCADLLQSTSLADVLASVAAEYDYIFIDTSPVLRVTDATTIATQGVGAVMYVARANHTPKPLIRYSLDLLKDARMIGLIINSIETHRIGSLYYSYQYPNCAYYSCAYRYGHDYYHYSGERGPRRKRAALALTWWGRARRLRRRLRQTFLSLD